MVPWYPSPRWSIWACGHRMTAKTSQCDVCRRGLLHLWHLWSTFHCGLHFMFVPTSNDQQQPTLSSTHPVCQVALEPLAKLIVHAANQKAMAVAIANAANTVNTVNAAATLGDWSSDENGGNCAIGAGFGCYFMVFHGDFMGI